VLLLVLLALLCTQVSSVVCAVQQHAMMAVVVND
jgi:hypothetical protein